MESKKLNNKNMFGHPDFDDVVFLVEATSQEKHSLWQEWSSEYTEKFGPKKLPAFPNTENIFVFNDNFIDTFVSSAIGSELVFLRAMHTAVLKHNKKIEENNNKLVHWEQVGMGYHHKIGEINDRPIYLDLSFAYINDKKVLFYECTSHLVDYEMVENWLKEKFQLIHDETRWCKTNAANFHICVNRLAEL